MKKTVIVLCTGALLLTLVPTQVEAKVNRTNPGGVPAFLIGCVWGLREGLEWNEGAELHWREWLRIVPFVGAVIAIWDGVECAQGATSHDWAKANGANWY